MSESRKHCLYDLLTETKNKAWAQAFNSCRRSRLVVLVVDNVWSQLMIDVLNSFTCHGTAVPPAWLEKVPQDAHSDAAFDK